MNTMIINCYSNLCKSIFRVNMRTGKSFIDTGTIDEIFVLLAPTQYAFWTIVIVQIKTFT